MTRQGVGIISGTELRNRTTVSRSGFLWIIQEYDNLQNKPGLTKSIHGLPGLSDHDIVCADCHVRARVIRKPTRKIYLCSKTDWIELKARMIRVQR